MSIKYYNVAFLTHDNTGWNVSLSSVAEWRPGKGWNRLSPGSPDEPANCFKGLQQGGAKILLSFGGYMFDPPDEMTNPRYVNDLAQAIAYSFLGGSHEPQNDFADWQPAFSDWHFDGIDLALERSAGSPMFDPSIWVDFARCIKKYAPGSVITGAPQSAYLYDIHVQSPFGVPFPDRSSDTCGYVSEPFSGDFLLSTDNIGLFDTLFVVFYNQFDRLEFPGEELFEARFCQLKKLVCSPSQGTPQFFVGVAAEDQGINGMPPGNYDACKIGDAINSALEAAGGYCTSEWFGGVMGWQSPGGTQLVQDILMKTGGSGALYGFRDGDPGWCE